MGYQEPKLDLKESLMHRKRFSEPASAANDRVLRKSRLIRLWTQPRSNDGRSGRGAIRSVLFPMKRDAKLLECMSNAYQGAAWFL